MADEEKYLTVEELAEKLKLSTRTVLTMISKGEIPAVKLGAQYRIEKTWEPPIFKPAMRLEAPKNVINI